ncbi:hypothetical protein EV356DRAFT_268979 [Viridothelium virens]|uniref:Uncharacterized protein n=1 Tax=Viridothelium virens TaxID=1048519 RepID=A0A6A6HKX6_VIRVR|nr:hypothetical protein EV356DRAFT_268979 [Viridothelium virens]
MMLCPLSDPLDRRSSKRSILSSCSVRIGEAIKPAGTGEVFLVRLDGPSSPHQPRISWIHLLDGTGTRPLFIRYPLAVSCWCGLHTTKEARCYRKRKSVRGVHNRSRLPSVGQRCSLPWHGLVLCPIKYTCQFDRIVHSSQFGSNMPSIVTVLDAVVCHKR